MATGAERGAWRGTGLVRPDEGRPLGRALLRPRLDLRAQAGRRALPRPPRRRRRVQLLSRTDRSMNGDYPELVEALEREPAGTSSSTASWSPSTAAASRASSASSAAGASAWPCLLYLFDVLRLDGTTCVPAAARAQGRAAPRAELPGAGALHAAPQRARRGDVPRGLPQGPGGHHRQARRQPLPRDALERLAQAEVPRRAGAGDRRLHGAAGLAHRLRRAARRLLGGRRAELRGQGGNRLRPELLRELGKRLRELERDDPPFADVHPIPRGTHWVEPELVGQIGFTEWTRDGRLRHPRFLGLRDDKPAREVVRERPA